MGWVLLFGLVYAGRLRRRGHTPAILLRSLASPFVPKGDVGFVDAFNSPFRGIFVRRVVVEGSPRLSGSRAKSCLYVRQ